VRACVQVILQVSTSALRFIVSGIICVSTAIAVAYSPIAPDVAGPPYLAYTALADGSGQVPSPARVRACSIG
jgi:hypothetical protein